MKIKIAVIILFNSCLFAKCNSQQNTLKQRTSVDSIYTYHNASPDGIGKFYMGREIAHVMGAEASSWLERYDRNEEENSNLAIENINIAPNGIIADIGAGTGFYSFKLSPKVPEGKIYAVELQEELIIYLKNKKRLLKDSIVEVIKSTKLSPNLPVNSIDLAIMVDVYHELEFPREMIQAIKASLKTTGKLLLIEYRGEDQKVPIKALHKNTVTQLNRELEANGFKLSYRGDFLPWQHFLLYEKTN